MQRANWSFLAITAFFRSGMPLIVDPSGSVPEESMSKAPSFVRQEPIALKFSIAKPIASIRVWQFAHDGFARCSSMRFLSVPDEMAFWLSSSSGTLGGGGGGGVPRICSRTQRPRLTGDVRVGFDVTVRIDAWVSRPP